MDIRTKIGLALINKNHFLHLLIAGLTPYRRTRRPVYTDITRVAKEGYKMAIPSIGDQGCYSGCFRHSMV